MPLIFLPRHEKLSVWSFATRLGSNPPSQPQKQITVLKFWHSIFKHCTVQGVNSKYMYMYADQTADAQADLHLCCLHMTQTGFVMTWLNIAVTYVYRDLPVLTSEGSYPGGFRNIWRTVCVTYQQTRQSRSQRDSSDRWLSLSAGSVYRKFPKYSDTPKNRCNRSKIWTMWLCHRVMSPNDADRMANSVDPDQTAP